MYIKNDRNGNDSAWLESDIWSGNILIGNDGYPQKDKEYDYARLDSDIWSGNILIGNDGYPKKHDWYYCIGGGEDGEFKAIAIEFYGVRIFSKDDN